MIHKPILPPESAKLLKFVVQHQMCALRVAARMKIDDGDVDPFKSEFARELSASGWKLDEFKDAKTNKRVEPSVWITRKKETLFRHLVDLSQNDDNTKQEIVNEIVQDHELLQNLHKTRPGFSRGGDEKNRQPPSASLSARNATSDFLEAYYNEWLDGFPRSFFPSALHGSIKGDEFRRRDFVREFADKNGTIFVCFACDGAGGLSRAQDRIHADLDHFLPKSQYPQFSCDPYNLIPLCKACNSNIKGAKDPLGDSPTSLLNLPLPYREANRALRSCTYIRMELRDREQPADAPLNDAGAASPLTLTLLPITGHSDCRSWIDSMNELYELDKRWSSSADQLGDLAFRRMLQFMSVDLTNPREIEDRIAVLMAMVERHDVGKDPCAFLLVWMLHHYLTEIENAPLRSEAPIVRTLHDWFAQRTVTLDHLLEAARKIRGRVPSGSQNM